MSDAPIGWTVELDATEDEALAVLDTDRLWAGYAIADLDPVYRAYTQVAVAQHTTGATAACTLYRHPAFNALVPHGDVDGLAALLAAIALPQRTFLHVRPEQRLLLGRYYSAPGGLHEMLRMAVAAGSFQPPMSPQLRVVRLGMDDLTALEGLYASYATSAFSADQLTHGVFYGMWADDKLLAAAGTHTSSAVYGVAAVGNVYTRPEARGQGYATAVTAAVVADLLAQGCRDVILNVGASNAAARTVYEHLGFRIHCRYWEGGVIRR